MSTVQRINVVISQTVAELWLFNIFKWQPSAILDLLCACLDHPRRVFAGIYHCAKFGWNRYSGFDNTQVLKFNDFGLKMRVYAPTEGFWEGDFSHKWEAVASRLPLGTSDLLIQKHVHATYRSLRSDYSFSQSSPFCTIP